MRNSRRRDASGALIARHLRIRTQRARAGDAAGWIGVALVFGREDLVRRGALLHPMLKRGPHRIAEVVGSWTANTMLHAGNHVESGETLGILAAHLRGHAFVVIDGGVPGACGSVPAVFGS